MLYVVGRKSFKVRREKKLYLCRVPKITHGKLLTLLCAKKKHTTKSLPCVSTRQNMDFAVCIFLPCVFVEAPGKVALCRVPDKKHTAKT